MVMILEMTPEEKYDRDKKFVLRQIKEKILYSQKSNKNFVVYRVGITPYSKFEKTPPSVQINILKQLSDEGVIKILDEKNKQGYGAFYSFSLEVVQSKFDQLYDSYSKIILRKEEKEEDKNIESKINEMKEEEQEIIKLSPEFYGVGINLKLLYKNIKSFLVKKINK